MTQLLPQPTLPDCVPGIIALDPCALQCGDCGEVYDIGRAPAITIILSACNGWGFLRREPHVRRCGPCNETARRGAA